VNSSYASQILLMVAIAMSLMGAERAHAQFKTLYAFKGGVDGIMADPNLVLDSSGNLYGTTSGGGVLNEMCQKLSNPSCGTVFELSPASGGIWQETIIYRFAAVTTGEQRGVWLFDGAGNLYGTIVRGGLACSCGAVFELSPAAGGPWTKSTVYNFHGVDGSQPYGLVKDAGGNLYGTTDFGGDGEGVVYELSPAAEGAWTQTVLHTFDRATGAGPGSALFLDNSGNLFGTALVGGGSEHPSTIFELYPESGGGWSYSKLAPLPSATETSGTVFEDSSGKLFGTTQAGGAEGGGTVFEFSPLTGGDWTRSVLHIFDPFVGVTSTPPKGSTPVGLVEDGDGGFYGTTIYGGNSNCTWGCGVLFHLTRTSSGGWSETILHSFSGGHDGAYPGPLIQDGNGNIFGTTSTGGNAVCKCGTVFEMVNPAGDAE
jgi:uncharacterized repeat protein (TIGR03803 family)